MIDIMKYKTGNFMKAVYITAIITVAILLPILSSIYVNVIDVSDICGNNVFPMKAMKAY